MKKEIKTLKIDKTIIPEYKGKLQIPGKTIDTKKLSHNVYYIDELTDREKQIFSYFMNKKWRKKIGSDVNNAIALIKTKHICLNEELNQTIQKLENKAKKLKEIKNELNEVALWL